MDRLPQRDRLLALGHPRSQGARHDLLEIAEVFMSVGKPGINHVGVANILHPHGPVGLPALVPDTEAAADRRTTVGAVHCSAVLDMVFLLRGRDLLHVPLRDILRMTFGRPGFQGLLLRLGPLEEALIP